MLRMSVVNGQVEKALGEFLSKQPASVEVDENIISIVSDFLRIDQLRRVETMKTSLSRLPANHRKKVIFHALKMSLHQFTWSWLAMQNEIHESEWPKQEKI